MRWQFAEKLVSLLHRDRALSARAFLEEPHFRHLVDPLPLVARPKQYRSDQRQVPIDRSLAYRLQSFGLHAVDDVERYFVKHQRAEKPIQPAKLLDVSVMRGLL